MEHNAFSPNVGSVEHRAARAGRRVRVTRWLLAAAALTAWALALLPGTFGAATALAQDGTTPAAGTGTTSSGGTSAGSAAKEEDEPSKKASAYDPKQDATVDIDMMTLIKSEEVFKPEASDGIWDIRPQQGKNLIQIPFKIAPGKRDSEMDQNDIKIKGARFIAWKLTDPPEKAPKGSNAAREIAEGTPDGPPLITRKFTVTTGGEAKYGLDRSIFGGTIKDATNRQYIYKLKPDLLNKKRPVPAPKQDPVEYRSLLAAYQQLQKDVKALPDEAKVPLPMRVWGVFELLPNAVDLDINMMNTTQWKISLLHFKTIRKNMLPVTATIGADGKARINKEGLDLQNALTAILAGNPPQPLSARCAAYNLIHSRLIGIMEPNDPTYRIVQQILKSTDTYARTAVIKELSPTSTLPTQATIALLREATLSLNPFEKGQAFKDMLGTVGAQQSQDTISTANQLLADASGPPVRELLGNMLEASETKPESRQALLTGVKFDALPDKRLDEAMSFIVEKSSASALAAAWLDVRFLGSPDQKIVRRTLEMISTADASDEWFREASKGMMSVVLTAPKKGAEGSSSRIKLGGPIPISTGNHAFFRTLQSGDKDMAAMAWASLPRFTFVSPTATEGGTGGAPSASTEQADPYVALMRIALDQTPTPTIVVDFLSRQKDSARVLDALVKLVLRGTDKASVQATRALLRPRTWPLDQALLKLPYGDRHGFGTRVYENLGARVPLAVFLMRQRQDNNPLVAWFGKEMAAGRVPNATDYAAQYGNDERLLELVPGSDADLAQGAVSALVLAAGGDDIMAREQATKLRGLKDQSPANIRAEWLKVRRNVYVNRIQKAAGAYRLVLRIGVAPTAPTNPGDAGKTPATPPAGPQEISLGIVQLTADATGVRLANGSLTMAISDSTLAIRMEKPSELKNFAAEQLAKVPLEKSDKAVDLTLHADGSWRGSLTLSDGRPMELIFQPASGSGG